MDLLWTAWTSPAATLWLGLTLLVLTFIRARKLIAPALQLLAVYAVATAVAAGVMHLAWGEPTRPWDVVARAMRASGVGLLAAFASGKATPKVVRRG